MSRFGSSGGGAPKQSGSGKPSKGYSKVSGADDATIDIRKHQKPPADLPPSLEPANEPPSDSMAPVEPVEVDTAPPEQSAPPQDGAEMDGDVGPTPLSPAVPDSGEDHSGTTLPQTIEEQRSSLPRPGPSKWIDMPEANASTFNAENPTLPADKVVGKTRVHGNDRAEGTNIGAMEETGSANAQSDASQEPTFLSIGERREPFVVPSRLSPERGISKSTIPIAGSPPMESGDVRPLEIQGAALDPVMRSAEGISPTAIGADQISPGGDQGTATRQSESDSWGAFGDGAMPTPARSMENARRRLTKADIGSRVRDRRRQNGWIAQVKNGTVIVRPETGHPYAARDADLELLDGSSVSPEKANKSKGGKKNAGRKGGESKHVGKTALIVPKASDEVSDAMSLHGFEITKVFHDYLRLIEQVTGRAFSPIQLEELLSNVTERHFVRLGRAALKAHNRKFTGDLKATLRLQWAEHTKQVWPTYSDDVFDKNGDLFRRKGDPYDAHHIVHQKYGGPHEWWNLTPVRSPGEHPRPIHWVEVSTHVFP